MKPVYRLVSVCLAAAFTLTSVFPLEAAGSGTPVYVSSSGKKYHRFDCKTLRSKKFRIELADAERSGYRPCLLCKPARNDDALYRVNIENIRSYRQVDIKKMPRGTLTRHIDGDTVHVTLENPPPGLNRVEKIRMIGVDTPETVHPGRGVEYFGREASDFTKKALLGKVVYIALDWDTRDRYGRLLAYIYTPDGGCHNVELLKQGYAHAYTRFPFQFLEEFRKLEREARDAKAGLWAADAGR